MVEGLVQGPAEHDHCRPLGPDGGGFPVLLFRQRLALAREGAVWEARGRGWPDIDAAVAAQATWLPDGTLFIPPCVNEAGPFPPFTSMHTTEDSSYSNFRYYAEMLSEMLPHRNLLGGAGAVPGGALGLLRRHDAVDRPRRRHALGRARPPVDPRQPDRGLLVAAVWPRRQLCEPRGTFCRAAAPAPTDPGQRIKGI